MNKFQPRGSTLLALSAQAIGERDGKRGVGYTAVPGYKMAS